MLQYRKTSGKQRKFVADLMKLGQKDQIGVGAQNAWTGREGCEHRRGGGGSKARGAGGPCRFG